MKIAFNLDRVIKDFVFLFFFVGNDFLPRSMAYNIKQTSIEELIDAFKIFLKATDDYVIGSDKLNMKSLTLLTNAVAQK
jgi:5'-3' exonuclease